jgi:hypothetical protein
LCAEDYARLEQRAIRPSKSALRWHGSLSTGAPHNPDCRAIQDDKMRLQIMASAGEAAFWQQCQRGHRPTLPSMARRLALAPRGAAGVQRRDTFAALRLQARTIGLDAKRDALGTANHGPMSGSELGSGDLERRHAISAGDGYPRRYRPTARSQARRRWDCRCLWHPRLSRDFFLLRMVEGDHSQV